MAFEKKCDKCEKPIVLEQTDEIGPNGKPRWKVTNPDGTAHDHPKAFGGGGGGYRGKSEAEMHDIRREAVLNAAVAYSVARINGGENLGYEDVLVTANAFLKWVETGRPTSFQPSATEGKSSTAPVSQPRPAQPASSAASAASSTGSNGCAECGESLAGGGIRGGKKLCREHYGVAA